MGKCLLEILLMMMLIIETVDTHVPLAKGSGITVKREVLHGGGIFAEQFNRVQDFECRPGRIGTLGGPVDQHSIAAGVILQIIPDIIQRIGVKTGQRDHGADLAGGGLRDNHRPAKILFEERFISISLQIDIQSRVDIISRIQTVFIVISESILEGDITRHKLISEIVLKTAAPINGISDCVAEHFAIWISAVVFIVRLGKRFIVRREIGS